MNTITPFEALMKCRELAGSEQKLGDKLGCTQQAVNKMIQSAKRMSHQYVLAAEAAYGVSRHDLRPDIYPRTAPMVAALQGQRFYGVGRRAAS